MDVRQAYMACGMTLAWHQRPVCQCYGSTDDSDNTLHGLSEGLMIRCTKASLVQVYVWPDTADIMSLSDGRLTSADQTDCCSYLRVEATICRKR